MRKQVFAALAAAFLCAGVAGCATDPVTGSTTVTIPVPSILSSNPDVANIIAQVQSGAQKACAFVPTVETIENLVTAFTGAPPALGIINGIVSEVCAAVGPVPASAKLRGIRLGAATAPVVVVNGKTIAITGEFVSGARFGHRLGKRHR